MPKNLPATCKVCGAKRREGVAISRRGLCPTHAMDAYLKSLELAKERGREGGLIGGPIGMASRWAGRVKRVGGADDATPDLTESVERRPSNATD